LKTFAYISKGLFFVIHSQGAKSRRAIETYIPNEIMQTEIK